MKKINKGNCPEVLDTYLKNNPNNTWNVFCDETSIGKRIVQQQIRKDQRGLCAYCEIDLMDIPEEQRDASGAGKKADFRIDHFHPQSDHSDSSKNWGLDWKNMFGVCTGGNERCVVNPQRFSEANDNRHCDSLKKNHVWDGIVLNPLDIPATPCLWNYEPDSTNERYFLKPDKAACMSINPETLNKAIKTLDLFNLNCLLLAEFRWATIKVIRNRIEQLMSSGIKEDDATKKVMKETFDYDAPTWPPFFSTIRAYFGKHAEERLREINYNG